MTPPKWAEFDGPPEFDGPAAVLPGEARVLDAAQRSLAGERSGLARIWPFLGPAFIASVAYVDPGNFATNVAAGSRYGYALLWVILAANLMAMLIQTLSAKLGIATGQSLPEVCRDRFPRPVTLALWGQAEIIAMATDLAEFIGAAIGMNLLFHIPLLAAAVLTGITSFAILTLQTKAGFRHLEALIVGLVGIIVAGFAFQVFLADPSYSAAAKGLFTPRLPDSQAVLLATGILGATVMPHVIYLHSALTRKRIVGADGPERRRVFRFEQIDVVIAMIIAGVVNMSMLVMAAGVFHSRGLTDIADLDEVYKGLGSIIGTNASAAFGIALLASGLSSSSIGTLAGQIVMEGFLDRQIPLFLRRGITMVPALVIIALDVNASTALVVSQVVLSFGIPFALIPLVVFCRDRGLMGSLTSRGITTAIAAAIVAVIVSLNALLIYQTLT